MSPYQKEQVRLMRQMELSAADGDKTGTMVPVQKDYVNDARLCLTTVTFIPSRLAKAIRVRIIEPLSRIEPDFYYYPDTSLHMTIQNIRTISDPPTFGAGEIEKAKQVLKRAADSTEPFRFQMKGLLCLPSGLSTILLVSDRYNRFIQKLRKDLSFAGIPDDKKYFADDTVFGNCTFCRFTHVASKQFMNELYKHRSETLGSMNVGELSLIRTNAICHPSKTVRLAGFDIRKN